MKVFAGGFPAWEKLPGTYAGVDAEYVAGRIASDPMTMLVDSRPKKAKYDKGHIPSAISLPDTQFDQLKGKLPADKAVPLIFYCGGYT